MNTRSTIAAFSALFAMVFTAAVFAAESAKSPAKDTVAIKCPVTGNPIDKNAAVDFEGCKVYLCCENCPTAFKKDPAKFAAKSHLQMVQTGQLTQVGCPFSGGKPKPELFVDVAGVKVLFCCDGCQARAKQAKPDELVSLVFKDTSRGFRLAKDVKQGVPSKK